MPSRPRLLVSVVGAALATLAYLAFAGPLNPPGGPVAPGYKTLTEVEPRTAISAANTPGDAVSVFEITQPGSYYLTGDVSVPASKSGLLIDTAAAGPDAAVTIDLMGFAIRGQPGSLDGVRSAGASSPITVRNGEVLSCGEDGVDLVSAGVSAVENVNAASNIGSGIQTGHNSRVVNCSALANGENGIDALEGCTVEGCVAAQNIFNGISVVQGVIVASAARENQIAGIVGGGLTVRDCSVRGNHFDGMDVNSSTVVSCSALANGGAGLQIGIRSSVTSCSSNGNGAEGILGINSGLIISNTCTANGTTGNQANIHVVGVDNRIEGNNCSSSGRGIHVSAPGNFIIRNCCSGNATDWELVAGNVYGPIIDRRTPAGGPVSGFSGPGTLSSNDPNANYSY